MVWLSYMMAFFTRLSIPPLSPFLQSDLNLTGAQVGLFITATYIGYQLMQLPAGWLVDVIGVRKMLLVGQLIVGTFIIATSYISSFDHGFLLLVGAGFGCGCLTPSTTKAVMYWFSTRERATVMGLKQTGVNIGGLMAAMVLPSLALAYTWRPCLLLVGVTAVLSAFVAFLIYREFPVTGDRRIPDSRETLRKFWSIFSNRDIMLASFIAGVLLASEFALITYLVLNLREVLLLSEVVAGQYLALAEGAGAVGKPFFGGISDLAFKGRRKIALFLVGASVTAMCVVFASLSPGTSTVVVAVLSIIFGLTAIGWGGLHLTLVGEFSGKEDAGVATALSSMISISGVIAGPPLFGYIIDITSSYSVAWYSMSVCVGLATGATLFLREERRKV